MDLFPRDEGFVPWEEVFVPRDEGFVPREEVLVPWDEGVQTDFFPMELIPRSKWGMLK